MSEIGNNNELVPSVRFPEFRAAGYWRMVKLGHYLTESRQLGSKGDVAKKLTVKLWGKGVRAKTSEIEGSVNTQYFRRASGQFIFSQLDFLNQAFALIPQELDGYESTADLPCFDISDTLDPSFLLETVLQPAFYKVCGEMADGGRKAKRIHAETFLGFSIPAPSKDEQRKIGESLQSLDELIAAETEKLEALKRHKKGLLQQLFPAEGETTPRLRFPQFRNVREWIYSLLEEVAQNLDNRRIPISSSQRVRGGTPYYGASGIVDYVEGYIFDETLLCVSEDGANLVARSTPIAFTIEGQTWVNNHAHVLKFADRHIHSLVEAYLNQMDLGDFLTGMAQPKLNRGMLDTIAIPLPSLQQEAASVAEVIITADIGLAESARRLNALHQHKDALMQQLFPSMEEEHPNF